MPRRILTAALLASVLAGCGGSGPPAVSPAAYVHSVCTTIFPYERDVVVRGAELQAGLISVKTPVQAKRVLQAYITTVSADTDSAVTKLQGAGSPSVKNGRHISSAILTAFVQVRTAMHQALAEVGALPTASLTAFRTGIQKLELRLVSIRGVGQRLQSSALDSPQLHSAAAKEPACRKAG